MKALNLKIVFLLFGLCVLITSVKGLSGTRHTKDVKEEYGHEKDRVNEHEYNESNEANKNDENETKDEDMKYFDYSYGYCGYERDSYGYCNYKPPGLYSHSNNGCYIQCDHFGNTFVRPCAYGTYWRGGRGPSYYNKCTW
ncbi:unnamed protein product [Owenia fusiformis]|uniref:Uncharacterized protein n=1 Tax=Owenia fusiformis TaxID=6347 RepID=A0A8J1TTG5_OWEFU|nr:unnamed protein product [Owenia fusiformis]